MKVFILKEVAVDSSRIIAVYDSREKAEQWLYDRGGIYLEEFRFWLTEEQRLKDPDIWWGMNSCEIQEHEVL